MTQLPTVHPLHSQMHPLHRLRSHSPSNMNLLLRILHAKPEPSNNTRHSTPQLRPRKVLPNTTPLPMQERNLREIRPCPTMLIRRLLPRHRIRIDPSFRQEILTRRTPELRTAVYSIRAEDEPRALGNGFVRDDGVADGFADCHRDGWVQAEDFLADTVEERHGFEVGPGDWGVAGGDAVADFGAEAVLVLRVEGEEVAAPGQGAGCRFVLLSLVSLVRWSGGRTYASSEESQHLVDQLVIGEITAHHHGSQNIGFQFLGRRSRGHNSCPLLLDNFIAEVAQESSLVVNNLIQRPWQTSGKPLRQHKVDRQESYPLPYSQDYAETESRVPSQPDR